jgi:hypothetical protein
MRTKVKKAAPESALMRVLDAFAQELAEVADEEIRAAATELRMDPSTQMSAAFAGVTYPGCPRLSDYFELPEPAGGLLPRKPPRDN